MTLKLNGTNSEAAPAYAGDDADTGLQCGTDELKLVTGGTARATVDSSGRLLVGTTTAGDGGADNLTIADSGAAGITIRSGSSTSAAIYFADGTSGSQNYQGIVQYVHSGDELQFYTNYGANSNARMIIDSSGRVGIGTATASTKLDVESSGVPVEINSSNSNSNKVQLSDAGTIRGYFGASSSASFIVTSSGASEQLRVQSGGGISFNGDTAATNALNDYEEGDWTPSMNSGGWTGFTINSAKYIKIGALVFVQCFVGPLTGSGTGSALKLGSLPFNSIASGYTAGTVDFGEGGVKGAYCRTETNSNLITFFYSSENTSQTRNVLLGNQIGDNYIIINLTYFTSA